MVRPKAAFTSKESVEGGFQSLKGFVVLKQKWKESQCRRLRKRISEAEEWHNNRRTEAEEIERYGLHVSGNKGPMLLLLDKAVQKAPEKLKAPEVTYSEADKTLTAEHFAEKEEPVADWGPTEV